MTNKTADEIIKIYTNRRSALAKKMKDEKIDTIIFEDSENMRDPSVRYFTGHAHDAILIVDSKGKSILIPWDENLALQDACADKIIPYNRYERDRFRAVRAVLSMMKSGNKVELTPTTPYPLFLRYVDALRNWDVRCKEDCVHNYVTQMRAVKDEYEIECIKEAAKIGDIIIDLIEEKVRAGEIKTETDVALLIEKECRARGCERTGFDTLAAGPKRSFAIHCFPNYTSGAWPDDGLSILDFGVVYKGYTSDTTLTIAKGALNAEQEKLLALVQKAADSALALYKKDIPVKLAASKADEIFARAHRTMPHALGHGIGLEIHESPSIRQNATSDIVFKEGMIVTLEPGLYDFELGGVRLENDVLITKEGNEVITHSRIIRI